MKNLRNTSIGKFIDELAIAVAVLTLFCNLTQITPTPLNNALCIVSGIIGLCYLVSSIVIFICNRPKFDWHLINSNYLAKVIALALLFPSIITSGFLAANYHRNKYQEFEYSPKNLQYDGNLYTSNDTLRITPQTLLCDSVFVKKYNLNVINDSTAVLTDQILDPRISPQISPSIYWTVFSHFLDPGNQSMTTSQSGRGWSALIAILGVFLLNGLLVSSIVGWVDSRKEKWLKGEVRYPRFLRHKSYDVLIGGNDMVVGLVKQKLDSEKHKHILIQTSSDVESFRRRLFSILTDEQQKHIIIYYGIRTSEEDVAELCLGNAEEVYIVGEDRRDDDMESFHDTMNMECLNLVYRIYKESTKGQAITDMLPSVEAYRKQLKECPKEDIDALREKQENIELDKKWGERPRLNCRVMFEYQTTFSVFQFFDLDAQMDEYINFIPFNSYEIWAQNILINKCVNPEVLEKQFQQGGFMPLEGSNGIKKDDDAYVHLFVVGMSRMGIAMAIETAHLAHYPNYESKKIRTKITFIDKNAKEEKEFFMGRFQSLFALSNWRYGSVNNEDLLQWENTHGVSDEWAHLGGDFLDIEWEFINGGIECASIQDYILASANPNARITIAICLPESNRSHAAALYLNKKIYESKSVLQVLVYNQYGNAIVDAVSKGKNEYPFCGKLRGFGCNESSNVCKHLEFSESIGREIEKAYSKKQYAINVSGAFSGKSKSAGKWSSIYNGNTLWTKLRSAKFDFTAKELDKDAIELLANVEHNRWVVEELLMNFRPLTAEEQNTVISSAKKDDIKNSYKSQMAHLDICSNSKLKEVDGGVRQYDITLTECLVKIHNELNG